MSEPKPIAQVVGDNARRIRIAAGLTLDQVAAHAREEGLKWTAGKVGDLEGGRVSPSLPTLFALTIALHLATDQPVTLADLLRTSGFVRINDALAVRGEALTRIVQGESAGSLDLADIFQATEDFATHFRRSAEELSRVPTYPGLTVEKFLRVGSSSGLTEQRVSKELGITKIHLAAVSAYLWNASFSDERDRRAGPDANPQKRGRASRELKAELRRELGHGDDQ